MHQELHAPDPACGWVGAWFYGPGRELFWESAYIRPFAGAGEVYGLGGGGAEGGYLGWGEGGRDEDEAVAV